MAHMLSHFQSTPYGIISRISLAIAVLFYLSKLEDQP